MHSDFGHLFSFSAQANYWQDLYENPGSLFEHNMLLRHDYAVEYVRAHFGTDTRILDLGCGAGVLSEKLIEAGYRVTAADAARDMLTLAEKRLSRFSPGSRRLVHANCLNMPFETGQFDLVVCLGMFGYFDEVARALDEIRRVLRPGGTLIISVRNAYTPRIFDLWELCKFTARTTRRLIARCCRREKASQATAFSPERLRIGIYEEPAHLIRGVTQCGYKLKAFDGFGYGPLAIAERKLIPAAAAIRLSDGLNRAFRTTRLHRYSRWIADVSFFVFERPA